MEHVVKLGARGKHHVNSNRVNELDDAIRPKEARLELAIGHFRRRCWGTMMEMQQHPIAHCIGNQPVELIVVLLLDRLSLLQAVRTSGRNSTRSAMVWAIATM